MSALNRSIVIDSYGGPEVLRLREISVDPPQPGQILIRQSAIGVNFHDIYVRSGLYKTLTLPGVPGLEGVGIVAAVGAGVDAFRVGDRVGYIDPTYGGYAEFKTVAATRAVRLPDALGDAEGAASLVKALTTCILLTRVHRAGPGQTILVQAAAGGMGQLLCGWARHLGCTVIGTASTPEKAQVAHAAGAHHCILYRNEDVATRVAEITDGEGVTAAYDSVGRDTFEGSLASLAFCGHLVNFGQSSGPVEPIAPSSLAERSLTLSRPILFHFIRDAASLAAVAQESFAAFAAGAFKAIRPTEFPIEEAALAHELLESRQSPGGVVLQP
jgi:NADPH:quinone reductase